MFQVNAPIERSDATPLVGITGNSVEIGTSYLVNTSLWSRHDLLVP